MSRRHVLSTHLLRRRARAAQRHYKRIQEAFIREGALFVPEPGEPARIEAEALGIDVNSEITVERAIHQRGKWLVLAS